VTCAICDVRKDKRFCPAVHGRICAQCCGEQREVTLDCPSECPYLQQSREHEKPRLPAEPDREALFLQIALDEPFLYEFKYLILGLCSALTKSARANRDLKDCDLIAALTSLAKSYETMVNSGLIYEPPTANLAHRAVAAEIETMLKEYRASEQQHLGFIKLKDNDVLKALVFLVRTGLTRTSGRPKSRAFVDFLFTQAPEKQAANASPQEARSRIIMP
jgi:hypothetical protein